MTINRKNCDDSRTVRVLVEQVSQIQEDLYNVNANINTLDRTKADLNSIQRQFSSFNIYAMDLTAGLVRINAENASLYAPNMSATDFHSDDADFLYVDANTGYIRNLSTDNLTVNGVTNTFDLNAIRVNVTETINVPNVITNNITATSLDVAGLVAAGSLSSQNASITRANVNDLNVANTLNVKDLNITGSISGLNNVDIEANSITTPIIDADEITAGAIYTTETSDDYHLVPSPHLDNNDHYTIILPSFTGTVVLKWADNLGNEIWSATVIGNGKDYEIHWGTVGQTLTVTKLYQYEGRLYIRENANGSLYYSYHTTDELGEITIMYNYTALDSVIDVEHMLVCTRLSGQISFGDFYAPSFVIGDSVFENLTVRQTLTVEGDSNLNRLSIANESINWNGNDVKVCDDFTTDWIQ